MSGLTESHCVVAFYGLATARNCLAEFYDRLLLCIAATGCVPRRLGIEGKGFPRGFQEFSRLDSQLRRNGFSSVNSLDLQATLSAQQVAEIESDMGIVISFEHGGYLVFSVDSSIATLDQLLQMTRPMLADVLPHYGIGYERPRRLGPTLYALGVNYGFDDVYDGPVYEEKVRNTAWGASGMRESVYSYGLLRDVYSYNFLAEAHLSRVVDRHAFKDWVARGLKRGNLSPFESGLTLWRLDDRQIPAVRDVLRREGMIYDALTFVPPQKDK